MIVEKQGRARSFRTQAEEDAALQKELDSLTDDEREALMLMLAELEGDQAPEGDRLIDLVSEAEYKHEIVDIETFVKDPYFLGNTCETLYEQHVLDLKELFSGGYQEAIWTGSIGYGKCVDPTTEVFDPSRGRRRAGDLGDDWSVASMDQSTGKLRVSAASAFASGEKPCVELNLAGGQRIALSQDHPVFTARGWIPAGGLQLDDLVATPRRMPGPTKPLEVSDAEVKLVAYLASDGGCTGNTTFTNMDPLVLREFTEVALECADPSKYDSYHRHISPEVSVAKGANSGKATTLQVKGIRHLVKHYGMDAKATHKRIPASFYLLPDQQVVLFLNRFWACDGSVGVQAPWTIETTLASEGLVDDLRFLLLRLGIQSRKCFNPKKFRGKLYDAWTLSVSGADNVQRFLQTVGPVFSKEEACAVALDSALSTETNTNVDVVPIGIEELREIREELGDRGAGLTQDYGCPKGQRLSRARFARLVRERGYTGKYAWLAETDLLWERVRGLQDLSPRPVVDLSVPGDTNFVANNIVVHNTFVASIAVARVIYEISCLNDPHRSFGIASGSNISIVCLSVNEQLAMKVAFENIATKLKASPYFQENFPFKETKKEFRFPNSVWLAARATTDTSVLGLNVISGLLDETNFMDKGRADARYGTVDHAETIYAGMKRRMKSRFERRGKLPGMLFLVSSKKTTGDFTARRIRESRDDSTVFVRDYALWDVKPEEYYSADKFLVICGNEQVHSQIIEKEQEEQFKASMDTMPDGVSVLEVPEDFRLDFERDIEGSLRDIAGMSTVAISPFIQRREKLVPWPKHPGHPFSVEYWDPSKPGNFVWERMVRMTKEKDFSGYTHELLRPIVNPTAARHIHIDPAYRKDRVGFCMGHVSDWIDVTRRTEDGDVYQERAPVFYVDVILQVVPPVGDEIVLGDIRRLVYQLSDHGYIITGVTMDTWQCLAEGTLVNTSRGLIPIEEVRKGDIVPSRSGPRPVLNTWAFGEQDTIRITTSDGDVLEGTEKHRIEVQVGWRKGGDPNAVWNWGCTEPREPVYEWKRLDELRVGDAVHMRASSVPVDCANSPLSGKKEDFGFVAHDGVRRGILADWELPDQMTEELAEWLGLIWGNGDLGEDCVRLTVTRTDSEDARSVFQRLFGVAPEWRPHEGRASGYLSVSSRWLVRWMRANGLEKPLIPEAILRSGRSVKAAFLRGLFGTDGNVGRLDGYCSLSTSVEALARQVRVLLRTEFGVESKLLRRPAKRKGRYETDNPEFVVGLRGDRSSYSFGFSYGRKQKVLDQHVSVKGRRKLTRVAFIDTGRAPVFDLEVEGDPSYVANGFVSHNSVDALQQLKAKGFNAEHLSVDTQMDPYNNVKDSFYEGRILVYDYPPLFRELKQLEKDEKRNKVDHPPKGCFVGSTRIPLLDGSHPEISELEGREVWVYSCRADGTIVPGRARGRRTKRTTQLVDVVLDNGAVERCTPEHLWMLRDGSYKEAKDLRPGVDRLMPINRVWPVNGGYERVTDAHGRRTLTHHMVWCSTHGRVVPPEHCVHHRDHRKTNNDPENLELSLLRHHAREHTVRRHATDREYTEAVAAGLQRFNESAEGRRKHARARKRSDFRSDVDLASLEPLRTDSSVSNANSAARALDCSRNVVVRVLKDHGFASWAEFQQGPPGVNHKVRAVLPVRLPRPVWVYDLEVDDHHNFALCSGVFVHNSKDVSDSLAGCLHKLKMRNSRQPLPIVRGLSYSPDAWMDEQLQHSMAIQYGSPNQGVQEDRFYPKLAARGSIPQGMLPPFLGGGSGGSSDDGGWSPL